MSAFCAGGKHTLHREGPSGDTAHCLKKLSISSAVTYFSAWHDLNFLCRGLFCLEVFFIQFITEVSRNISIISHIPNKKWYRNPITETDPENRYLNYSPLLRLFPSTSGILLLDISLRFRYKDRPVVSAVKRIVLNTQIAKEYRTEQVADTLLLRENKGLIFV